MKKVAIILAVIISFSSCLRLDPLMFNNDNTIEEYKWDDYEGEVDFILDETYDIPADMMYEFTMKVGVYQHKIHAIYIGDPTTISKDTVIFYCHGNRDHMDFYWQRAKLLAHVGGKNRFGVLMIDYKGYGLSEGQSSEEGLVEDVDEGLEWLKDMGLTNERLIMYGFSLGTCPTITVAGKELNLIPSRIVTEAPYASTDVMAADAGLLDMPGSYYANDRFANAEYIKEVEQPFLWIHGTADDFLAIDTHGEVVYKNYDGVYKQAERVTGAGHGTVPQTMGFVEYCQLLENFITKRI